MDALELMRAALAKRIDAAVYPDKVPKDRPKRFVLIERTGGQSGRHDEDPVFSIDGWGDGEPDARHLADAICAAVWSIADEEPWAFDAAVLGVSRSPDPESGQPRYRVACTVNVQV